MAIRKDIVWTVAADGVTLLPAHPQDGGIQGEDKAVQVKFILGAEHPLVTGDYQIYIECVDATGGYDKTEVLTPDEEGAITALVPLAWTQYGGSITLSVVGEAEAQRIILDDARLTFRSRPGMIKRMQLLIQTYIQKLLNRAESAVGVAEKAATSANESAGKAAIARDAAQAAAQTAADEAKQAQKERVQVSNAAAVVAAQKDEATAAAASAAERAFAAQTMAQAAATSASVAEADRASAGQILNRCREVEVDCEEYADDAKTAAENAAESKVASTEAAASAAVYRADAQTAAGSAVTAASEAVSAANRAEGAAISTVRFTEQELSDEQKAQARKNIGAGLPPLRFTVKKEDGVYTSTKTFQELSDACAENRILICTFGGVDLPLVQDSPVFLTFASNIAGIQRQAVIWNYGAVSAYIDVPSIQIGDQVWGGDDEEMNVDFTNTINGMIDDKVSVINVRAPKYGAKGDGVTDDTKAIQDALHAAEDKGLPLYIPAGNYLVSKTISTYTEADSDKQSNALNIFGAGMNTLFTTAEDFEGDYVLYIDYKRSQPSMLWVHDFAIDLNADVSGIYIHKMGMKSVVENLWITFKREKQEGEAVRTGIFCDSSVVATFQRIKVMGVYPNPDNMCCGMTLKGHSVKIVDCDVILCKWGIYLSGGSNWTIDNCRVDENVYGVYQNSSNDLLQDDNVYKFTSTFKNLTIRGNRFEHNRKYGIFLVSYGSGYLQNNTVTIANNYFTGLGPEEENGETKYRRAMLFGRCDGIIINENYFNGASEGDSDQNIDIVVAENISLRNNVASKKPDGSKSFSGLPVAMRNYMGFVDDIEMTQTTDRVTLGVRGNKRLDVKTSGTIDVTKSNVFTITDGVEVTGFKTDFDDVFYTQEITLIATGGSATIKNTGGILLADGADFAMGQFDTITLMKCYVYPLGFKWVEKCRSVNRATTVVEEG